MHIISYVPLYAYSTNVPVSVDVEVEVVTEIGNAKLAKTMLCMESRLA